MPVTTANNKIKLLWIIIALLVLGIATHFYFLFKPPKPRNLSQDEAQTFNLKAHWKQGNIVVLIRHMERCDRSDARCLITEHNPDKKGITVAGKAMAIKLGQQYQALWQSQQPIIYNSPILRTKQTAKFMFGDKTTDQKWLREGCKTHLLDNIFKFKPAQQNMVLITHATCIDRLGKTAGQKLINMKITHNDTYGISFFLAIDKEKKKAYVLGYLMPNEWHL